MRPFSPPRLKLKHGLGLEREMHFFLIDKQHGERRALPCIINLFGGGNELDVLAALKDPLNPLRKRLALTKNEAMMFLGSTVDPKLEKSGKGCAGLKPPRASMLEIINVDFQNRTVASLVTEFKRNTSHVLSVIRKALKDPDIVKTLGLNIKDISSYDVAAYPYGAAIFREHSESIMKDYVGSWQFTITLPYNIEMSNSMFVLMHEKFGNHLQWLEPLFVGCLFTPDPSCVVGPGYAMSGYRTLRYGWGNFAGTDVRRLHKGVGRKANVEPRWRKGLRIRNSVDLATPACLRLQETRPASTMDELCGKYGQASSDLRTFGFEKSSRVSGAPMSPGQGMEFRIFDNFDMKYLADVLTMTMYVAENSRRCAYHGMQVYNDADWIDAMQTAVMDGWSARVPQPYMDKLCSVLELPQIDVGDKSIHQIASHVFDYLHVKNAGGSWLQRFLGADKAHSKPRVPNINQSAWLHFYHSVYNTTNRRAIVKAINALPVRFTLQKAVSSMGTSVHLKRLMELVLHAERSYIKHKPDGSFERIKQLPRPLMNKSVECEDTKSSCRMNKNPSKSHGK